jgi:hypothetical protein
MQIFSSPLDLDKGTCKKKIYFCCFFLLYTRYKRERERYQKGMFTKGDYIKENECSEKKKKKKKRVYV